jgi:GDPmannose 4,6-dehydratase
LSRFLLDKGYEVFGIVRRASIGASYPRLEEIADRVTLFPGDMGDERSLRDAVEKVQPDEVYNLGAMSLVAVSWGQPAYTLDVNGLGCLRFLEAVRHLCPKARFYQASTSEMFGHALETPQRETTPFNPCSPYGAAKLYAHYITQNYRECYGLFACSGILFNHESPQRGPEFVTRKITQAVARIAHGSKEKLILGNLAPKRDWGFAGDYVRAMWLMLQQDKPDDYVIGYGTNFSVQEFVALAFRYANMDWRDHVVTDRALCRPSEVDVLLADASKARRILGWEPTVSFTELVKMMVDADMERV